MTIKEKLNKLPFEVSFPSHILLNDNLEPSALILYAYIKLLIQADGHCRADIDILAELMYAPNVQIKRWINQLTQENLITCCTDNVHDYFYEVKHV